MQGSHTLRVALVASCLSFSIHASAQSDAVLTQPVPDPVAEEPSEDEQDPMAWLGIGLKVGVAGNGKGEFKKDGVTTKIASRTGFQLSVPINLGGSGFGWVIDPYLNFASTEGFDRATGKKKDYGVTTIGVYTGPTINLHLIDPLYLGIGVGLKVGYASSDAFDFGLDVFGRVPVTVTYYVLEDIGALVEVGLGTGATGFAALPAKDAAGKEVKADLQFGSALTWDVSLGVRWP